MVTIGTYQSIPNDLLSSSGAILENLLSGFQNNCNYQGKSKKEEHIPIYIW